MVEQNNSTSQSDQFGVSKVHFCPDCKKPLQRKDGKMGPFWSCTGFPSCRTTLNDVDGKPSREPDEHYCCPVCTRRMVRIKKGDGHVFWVCTGSSRGCKVRLNDHQGKPESAHRCGHCGHLLVMRKGKHGIFWGCSSFPECTQTYRDNNGTPDTGKP
jgi:ssDNA-binding Zn-finger/Zn-ribbon topoisomerase 1